MIRKGFVFCLALLFASGVFADRKNLKEAEVVVENAAKALAQAYESQQFREFLPYLYSEAQKNLEEARRQLIQEEPDEAIYLAELSALYSSAAYYLARTEFVKWQQAKEEIQKWKKTAHSGSRGNFYEDRLKVLEKQLLHARLKLLSAETKMEQKGRVYFLVVEDKSIFIAGTVSISDAGKKLLEKVVRFAALAPDCTLSIEGHTAQPDKDNRSLMKASAVKDYLSRVSAVPMSKVSVTGYGNQQPLVRDNMVLKGPVNDRVVLVFELNEELDFK